MTCAEARIAIDARIDGELGAAEAPALEAHLAGCAACLREAEERRSFSLGVAQSLRRAMDGVESSREERARIAERLAAASRRRLILPARIAAAAVLAIAAGLVAWALSARPTAEQLALAEKLREVRSREAQIEVLQHETQADLAFARASLADVKPEDPRDLVIKVLERQLSPEPTPRPARNADVRRVSITSTVNGASVDLVQTADGRVRVTVPGRTVEASSMTELQKRHPDFCVAWSIEGSEGKVRVGDAAAAVELPVRLHLIDLTRGWDDDVPWEAWREWMKGRFNPAEMERWRGEMQERYSKAAKSASTPAVTVDFEAILQGVRGLGRTEAHEAVKRAEEQMKALEKRFKEMHELRGRARGLRVFAEDAKK